jgi:alkylhydroperoxidase family enzyme
VGHNVELGRALGLTQDQINLLHSNDWQESDLFTEKQKAAIRWADEVTHMRAKQNEAAFEEMKKYFTIRQIVELTFICGMWNLSGRVAEALHLVVEPPGKRIAFQKKDIEQGTR